LSFIGKTILGVLNHLKLKNITEIKPIKKKTIPEEVIGQFKSLIDSGHFGPGDKLPGERELAQKMTISRHSLREGLRALSLIGIIENQPGRGTYLSSSPVQWPLEPFSILFSIRKGTLLEILEARKSLEGTVAALAADRRNEKDLKAIEQSLKKMQLYLQNPEKYFVYELKFHNLIIGAARNSVIADLMEKIYRLLVNTRNELYRYASEPSSYLIQDYESHEKIFKHIKAREQQMAGKAMIDHMWPLEQRLKNGK
jgi:GntR family transcriptional regulator, transcriptional repressor for pyruvate dehydrogenase complex